MEPRPQRPRAQSGQSPQGARAAGTPQSTQQTQAYTPSEYPEGADPTAFIAPPRTEYDYSPLDLAPPGQRRRRQLVAAAVGGLSVVLLGAIIFFSYLLLRDEKTPTGNDDVLSAQTEIAQQQATIDAQQTIVAQAAAEQTEQAQALSGETPDASTEEAPAATEETSTEETPAATEGAETAGETPSSDEGNAPDLSGNAALTAEQLTGILPDAAVVPETLTEVTDTSRTLEEVVTALGGGRPAESNLTEWGWTGNVERQFTPLDPAALDPATTSTLTVSLHGFGTPESAAAALPFFSDILANSGYDEGEDPGIGDSSRLLTTTAEDGTTIVALYVQDGSVMYRIGGASATGDPTQDVINVANEMLGN